ncbi:hypothetical protein Q8A67_023634 [Cirrhinus molitorella]|uniref:Uncharacterized protein n=1 Tax=Cirrhinus molitorella TaxID=172907 RepID=A0AA88PE88_9TELE|nr:hypothetical protein Q8A67_023634 [Cirrhinus molitorella]
MSSRYYLQAFVLLKEEITGKILQICNCQSNLLTDFLELNHSTTLTVNTVNRAYFQCNSSSSDGMAPTQEVLIEVGTFTVVEVGWLKLSLGCDR